MKKKLPSAHRKHLVLYMVVTLVLVLSAALLGYYLTKRYKETITDTYHATVSNLSEQFHDVGSDVANEISKLEDSGHENDKEDPS